MYDFHSPNIPFVEPEPHSRKLGLVVLRGPTITIISPTDGSAEIDNPFVTSNE